MATSTGKTIGLIFLVIVILFLVVKVTPLIIAPFGIFSGVTNLFRMPGTDGLHFGPNMFRYSSFSLMSLVLLIIWIAVIVWVYRDAERRGMNGILWALLVLIGNLIGLLIYLIVRSDASRETGTTPKSRACPECKQPVGLNYSFCPHCGSNLQNICPGCKKPTEKNWKVCPLCGEKLTKE